ncbi:hypothetical protein E4U45_000865 [Claviceps purpurea]|nr:hypothetical protein E4U45_000865 [Claviceps purpurea]
MVHPPVTQANEQNSGLVANFEAGADVVLIRRQVATVNTNMTLIEKQIHPVTMVLGHCKVSFGHAAILQTWSATSSNLYVHNGDGKAGQPPFVMGHGKEPRLGPRTYQV